MREIVGLVLGAAAGAAGALFVTSAEGKAMIARLREEAKPEVQRAATEWEPVLNEVARAVRLAAKELETATADLRARIGEIAAEAGQAPGPEPISADGEAPANRAVDADTGAPADGAVDAATSTEAPPPPPAGGDAQPADPDDAATA